MKKILLTIPMIMFLMMTVFALDYSITGDRKTKTTYYTEKVSFDAWHDDGRESVYNPLTKEWSRGLKSQGKGIFIYSYDLNNSYGDYKRTLNLNLKEIYSYNYGNYVYSVNEANGIYWVKGNLPITLKTTVSYWYYRNGRVSISTPYIYIGNLAVSEK